MSVSIITNFMNDIRATMLANSLGAKIAAVVEEKTKVAIENFVAGLIVVLSVFLFLGFLADFIANIIGFTYPLLATIDSIETVGAGDDFGWLMYWIIFAIFCIIENFVDYFLPLIPFFYPAKVAFLLYCMSPTGKTIRAQQVFDMLIQPVFKSSKDPVEIALDKVDKDNSKKDN